MPLDPQNLIVYAIVLTIAGGFGWSLWHRRKRKQHGCGTDCGCNSAVQRNPVIEQLVARNQGDSEVSETDRTTAN